MASNCFMKIRLLMILVGAANAERISWPGDMSLHFNAPGKTCHETCVVGNGRLGAMDLGGVDKDRIVINESSMWSGMSF